MSFSGYVFGTTRLGDDTIPLDVRVALAREAIDAGLWVHTSDQYGSALSVLNAAFDLNRERLPNTIFKLGWESVGQIREQVVRQLDAVGLAKMSVGQLCLGGALAEAFSTNDAAWRELFQLRNEGLVDRFVLETLPAIRGGWASELIDALIFYMNPLQRFLTNELWDVAMANQFPLVAMRTVCGGSVTRFLEPDSNSPDYLKKRAAEIAPLFAASGCATWTEFSVRYLRSYPNVLATVGSTSRSANLHEFIETVKRTDALPQEIQGTIESLQRRWSDEHDRHAAPWSM